MHEHACFDAPGRIGKYIWQSVQDIWIKKIDGFDCYQSTPSVFLSPVNLWTVTEKEVYDFNALKIDRIVVDKVIKW